MLVRWRVGKQINRSLVGGVFTKGYFSSLFTCFFFIFRKNACDWMSMQHGLHERCSARYLV